MKTNPEIARIALKKTPSITPIQHDQLTRFDIINDLKGCDNIGIELGVASGGFSKKLVDSGKFKHVFGVDLYEDHHCTEEYKYALTSIGLQKNYTLLRMSFDDALELFDDCFFDFIYFDGYAHTGEEGGKSFVDWWKKLKNGGIYAGDDYHSDWPLVVWGVNALSKATQSNLNVTGTHNHYPSWFIIKNKTVDLTSPLDDELLKIGLQIRKESRFLIRPYKAPIAEIK